VSAAGSPPARPAPLRAHAREGNFKRPGTPALALTVEQAAAALSVSYDTFHEQIEPEIRLVRLGRRKLIPVAELHRWLNERAERVFER
jgi:excisionase family DNA binding protein